jgi:hypothetical protein
MPAPDYSQVADIDDSYVQTQVDVLFALWPISSYMISSVSGDGGRPEHETKPLWRGLFGS